MGKKKKLIKSIKSFEKQIEKHRQKIREYEGKDYVLKGYWKKEIEEREKQKKEKEERLRKK
jgi:hypothetical protein